MNPSITTVWHFPFMILASLVLFFVIVRIVIGRLEFKHRKASILMLSLVVVVFGMLFGKYGANLGLKWWIYYSIPMLLTVFFTFTLKNFLVKAVIIVSYKL